MGRSLRKSRKVGQSHHEHLLQKEKDIQRKSAKSVKSKNEHRYWLSEADRLFGPRAEVQKPKQKKAGEDSDSDVEMDGDKKSKTKSLWHIKKKTIKKKEKRGNVRGNKENRNLMKKVIDKEEKKTKRKNAG